MAVSGGPAGGPAARLAIESRSDCSDLAAIRRGSTPGGLRFWAWPFSRGRGGTPSADRPLSVRSGGGGWRTYGAHLLGGEGPGGDGAGRALPLSLVESSWRLVRKGESHGKQMGRRGSAGCACARGRQGQGTRSVVLRAAQPHSVALLDVPPA